LAGIEPIRFAVFNIGRVHQASTGITLNTEWQIFGLGMSGRRDFRSLV
jgi:hypothetical protein